MANHLMIHLDEVDSTNEFANFLASIITPSEGSVISTDNQTKGRGQVGRFWFSDPGQNIAQSTILYPTFLPVEKQFYLNIIVSLAVAEVVGHYIVEPNRIKVKWPNDVYVADEKVAGLLVQCALSGTSIQQAVIGVGLNVYQDKFPKDLPNPTSLIHHFDRVKIDQKEGSRPTLAKLRTEIHHSLMQYYESLKRGDFTQLKSQYESQLYKLGERIDRKNHLGEMMSGIVKGIDADGRLIIF